MTPEKKREQREVTYRRRNLVHPLRRTVTGQQVEERTKGDAEEKVEVTLRNETEQRKKIYQRRSFAQPRRRTVTEQRVGVAGKIGVEANPPRCIKIPLGLYRKSVCQVNPRMAKRRNLPHKKEKKKHTKKCHLTKAIKDESRGVDHQRKAAIKSTKNTNQEAKRRKEKGTHHIAKVLRRRKEDGDIHQEAHEKNENEASLEVKLQLSDDED